MQVHDFLEKSAAKFPDKIAVYELKQQISFKDLNKKANQIANYLKDSGVVRGDRVALLFKNSINYVAS